MTGPGLVCCPACHGTGEKYIVPCVYAVLCPRCEGTGEVAKAPRRAAIDATQEISAARSLNLENGATP